MSRDFDDLVSEAGSAPIDGWDFGWLDDRATEERPPWRYSARLAEQASRADAMLDIQSGGGELLATLPTVPARLVAVEGYLPNVAVAARSLGASGGRVVAADEARSGLPFVDASFDLVSSRHPIANNWGEIARVLRPGGHYISQQVGPRSVVELSEALLGPLPASTRRDPAVTRQAAERAGLEVTDLRTARLRMEFFDIGAVVWFLRVVVWIVPGFSVDRYRAELQALHRRIEHDGPFVAHSTRFLLEAVLPDRP